MQAENLVNESSSNNAEYSKPQTASFQEDFREILQDVKRLENCDIVFSDNVIRIDERTIVDRINSICIISVKNRQREITGYVVFNLTDLITKTIHG